LLSPEGNAEALTGEDRETPAALETAGVCEKDLQGRIAEAVDQGVETAAGFAVGAVAVVVAGVVGQVVEVVDRVDREAGGGVHSAVEGADAGDMAEDSEFTDDADAEDLVAEDLDEE
jgi:hypothetical protein